MQPEILLFAFLVHGFVIVNDDIKGVPAAGLHRDKLQMCIRDSYCTGSLNLFNHPTNVKTDKRVVCIVLKNMGENLRKIRCV